MNDKLNTGEAVKVLLMSLVMVGLVILVPIIIWTQIITPAIDDVKTHVNTVSSTQ